MSLASTEDHYGAVARLLHWSIALVIIVLLATGMGSDLLPKPAGIMFHKALGIIALGLGLARLAWWAFDRVRPRDAGPRLRIIVAKSTAGMLALLGVVMPTTGWLLSSAAGKPISMFGLFILPPLLAPDKPLAHLFKETHETIGTVILGLVALHIAGALFHRFILKDDVVFRMLPSCCKPKEQS
ncbi:MAG: cytochrome b [Rhodospirillaceae bacterium]